MFDNLNQIFNKEMFVLKSYFATIISVAQHFYQKREGSGRPHESGSATLPQTVSAQKYFIPLRIPILIPTLLSHKKLYFTFLI